MSRKFWEGGRPERARLLPRISYFATGLYEQSKLGLFFRFAHRAARVLGIDPRQFLECKTLAEQRRYFQDYIDPFFANTLVRWVAGQPATVFSLGIPPAQHQVMREEADGSLVALYRQRMHKLACGFELSDNYFAWQAFGRTYDHQNRKAIPDYLKAENFPTIARLAPQVQTHITTLAAYLKGCPDKSLNRFVLLDSQDWMPPQVIEELWRQIARVGQPGTRIIFRTAGQQSPVEAALPPELLRRYVYDRAASRRLHEQDRSAIYGMFHLYLKPE